MVEKAIRKQPELHNRKSMKFGNETGTMLGLIGNLCDGAELQVDEGVIIKPKEEPRRGAALADLEAEYSTTAHQSVRWSQDQTWDWQEPD